MTQNIVAPKKNLLPLFSLICGLAGLVIPFVTGFAGIALGWIALVQAKNDSTVNKPLAITGIVVSIAFTLFYLIVAIALVQQQSHSY